jgi:hypothetical protein
LNPGLLKPLLKLAKLQVPVNHHDSDRAQQNQYEEHDVARNQLEELGVTDFLFLDPVLVVVTTLAAEDLPLLRDLCTEAVLVNVLVAAARLDELS